MSAATSMPTSSMPSSSSQRSNRATISSCASSSSLGRNVTVSGIPWGTTALFTSMGSSGTRSRRTRSALCSRKTNWHADMASGARRRSGRTDECAVHLCEARPQEARHLHLAHPNALGDLRLGHAAHEPQLDDAPLAGGQRLHQAGHGDAGLSGLDLPVDLAQVRLVVGFVGARRSERHPGVGAPGLEGLEHLLDRHAGPVGDLLDGRRAAQRLAQLGHRHVHGVVQVLQAARHVHGPGGVAEVAAQFAHDRRHGEGREDDAVVGVEALDGLQHAEHGDLHQVVERLALVREALGAVHGQPAVLLDERVAHVTVAGRPELVEAQVNPVIARATRAAAARPTHHPGGRAARATCRAGAGVPHGYLVSIAHVGPTTHWAWRYTGQRGATFPPHGSPHVALFRFAEGITPAQVQAIDQGLAALPAAIPEIREYRFGIDLGLVERNADYAIVGDFATLEDYIAYRDHPDHRAFIDSCMEGVVTERLAVQYEA